MQVFETISIVNAVTSPKTASHSQSKRPNSPNSNSDSDVIIIEKRPPRTSQSKDKPRLKLPSIPHVSSIKDIQQDSAKELVQISIQPLLQPSRPPLPIQDLIKLKDPPLVKKRQYKKKTDALPNKTSKRKKKDFVSLLLPVQDAIHAIEESISTLFTLYPSFSYHLHSQSHSQLQLQSHSQQETLFNLVHASQTPFSDMDFCIKPKLSLWKLASHAVLDLETDELEESKRNFGESNTPMLHEHISYIQSKYKSRIAQSQFELKRKIAQMEEEHRLWADQQEEECQKRVLDLKRDYDSRKIVEVLTPCLDLSRVDSRDTRDIDQNKDLKEGIEDQEMMDYPDLGMPSPELACTPQVRHATACLFNLSSPECSIRENDLLIDDDDDLSLIL